MTAPLPDEDDSPFALPPAGVDIFTGAPPARDLPALEGTPTSPPSPPAASVAPATSPASRPSSARTPRGGNPRKERRERLRGRAPLLPTPRSRPGVPTDYEIVEFLALHRYATRAQIARRFYPLDAMPTQQAFDKRLGRLRDSGWIEKHDGPGRWPVYLPTRLGHAGIEIETEHLPEPSLATLEHTLGLADYLIEVETGRSPVPGFDGAPVRVITERQITAADKSPTKMRKPPADGEEQARLFYDTADGRQFGAATNTESREPIFGYWDRTSGRRGFPDALIVSADWAPGTAVTGGVAIEYERSEKTGGVATYEKILRAYLDTNWWTTSPEAQREASYKIARFSTPGNRLRLMPPGGRYRLVLYVCATERIKQVVEQVARNVAPHGFVWTVLAADSQYDVAPQRTTERWPAGKRQRRLSAGEALLQVSKDRLVEHLVAQGLAEDAVAVLLPATAEDRAR